MFTEVTKEEALADIMAKVKESYATNSVGVRLLISLTHQYFISGGFPEVEKPAPEISPLPWPRASLTHPLMSENGA
jgi:hypothetical protein